MLSTPANSVNNFVAPIVLQRFALDPSLPSSPLIESLEAAVLFADISGFTPLAEALARRGPSGAEALTQLLNEYLGRLVEMVAAHGGEVLSFAGDAVIAMWPTTTRGETLDCLTQRAAFCGLDIQTQLNNYQTSEGVHLLLRLGISAGVVQALHVGGVDNQWKFLLAGEPLTQMCVAEGQAERGQLVLDYAAWQYLGPQLRESARGDVLHPGYRLLHEIEAPPPLPGLESAASEVALQAAATAVRCYVTPAVLGRLDAHQLDWLAELRRVTVMFINIKGLNYHSPAVLDQVQSGVRAIQLILARFGGAISQLVVDSTGTVLIAAFGLPPRTHEDNAARAVQAALAIGAQLEGQGLLSSIGITTGRAFCGPVGNDRRREYTMVGNVVNLSARLMQASPNQILCDAITYQASQSRVAFEVLPPVALKGMPDPIAVFRPLSPSIADDLNKSPSPVEPTSMLGRNEEREKLAASLQALKSGGSALVLIEGEPGIGKSKMVEALLSAAQAQNCNGLLGAGNAIELVTPYHAWRAILSSIFGLAGVQEPPLRRTRVTKYFAAMPELSSPEIERLLPLLNTVLSLDFPENELTAQMTGQVRADNTRDLLRRVLQAFAAQTPTVLVLEDAHWMDSASWALALMVQQQVHPLLLAISTRPLIEPIPHEYKQMLQAADATHLRLEALPADNILDLVCQRLKISSLASSVADLIRQKAQGNPFFSEELALSLRESGILLIKDGNCRIAPDVDLDQVMFPDSVQGVITGRLDRLTPAQQLTLKAASVVGRVFPYKILHDIYPAKSKTAQLTEYLDGLQRMDITPLDTPEPNLAYIFKHVITQEVSYNLMLFAQRRELHQHVAQWYEQACAEDLAPYYSLLAHHWGRAEVRAKTIEYCEKAGEQALRDAAYREAVGFFSTVLSLDAFQTPAQTPITRSQNAEIQHEEARAQRLKRARRERQLAEALIGIGELLESRRHLERAAALMEFAVPTTSSRLALGLARQVLQQVGNRLWPTRHERKSADEKMVSLEAARAFERLAVSYFHDNQVGLTLFCSLRALNFSETFGPSAELARAYASSSISSGLVPLQRLSRFYDRRAAQVALAAGQLEASARTRSLSGLCSMNVAALSQARQSLGEAVKMAEELGHRRHWVEAMAMLSLTNHYAGRYNEAARQAEALYTAARRNGDVQARIWGLSFHAINLLALDQNQQAATLMDEAVALLDDALEASVGRQEKMEVFGALSLVRWRCGQAQAAQEAADEMLRLMNEAPPIAAAIFFSYTNATEVYLQLAERNRQSVDADKTPLLQATRAAASLHKFARVFPLGASRACLVQGTLRHLNNQPRRALRAWHKSLAIAERLHLPPDEGRAHYEIGRHLPLSDSNRRLHLERAAAIFEELGALHDLQQARAALSQSA